MKKLDIFTTFVKYSVRIMIISLGCYHLSQHFYLEQSKIDYFFNLLIFYIVIDYGLKMLELNKK